MRCHSKLPLPRRGNFSFRPTDWQRSAIVEAMTDPIDNRKYPPRRTLPAGFAHLLRLHRRAAGYGMREAADILEIDRGHLSRIERGLRAPAPK